MIDTRKLLKRRHRVERPDGHSHGIKEVKVRAGQSLAPGEPVCAVEYKRKSLFGRDSSETVYVADCAFDVEQYGAVEVLDIATKVGEEVPADGLVVFSYIVPATLANALESILADLVKDGTNLHSVHSGIPSHKQEGAVEVYAKGVDPDRILFLYDDTVLGTARTGFVVTDSALYLHDDHASYEVRFNRIESWKQTEEIVEQGKGDSVLERHIEVSTRDQTIQIPHSTGMLDWANVGNLLGALVALRQEGKTKDVDGPITFEYLPDETKLTYIEAIIWLVHHDDGSIDVGEFRELRLLMTQLNFSAGLRRRVLAAMESAHELVLAGTLDRLNDTAPKGAERAIAFSLVKDMVRVFEAANAKGDEAAESPQIAEACRLLDIGEEQLQVIYDGVELDRKIFDGSVGSDELKKVAEGLASKAAAVGVPIAAIYMSGSVVGLSAAGMTSGLAALGFGGLLGLSSMATGVGIAVLLGVGAYQGIRWALSGNDEKKRSQLRNLMLNEVLRKHQQAMADLGEDLAYFAQTIIEITRNRVENELKIERLRREVTLFADALAQLKQRGDGFERLLRAEERPQDSPERKTP